MQSDSTQRGLLDHVSNVKLQKSTYIDSRPMQLVLLIALNLPHSYPQQTKERTSEGSTLVNTYSIGT